MRPTRSGLRRVVKSISCKLQSANRFVGVPFVDLADTIAHKRHVHQPTSLRGALSKWRLLVVPPPLPGLSAITASNAHWQQQSRSR